MCYDKAYLTKKKDFYANRIGNSTEEVNYLKEQLTKLNLQATYHVSGFEHPLVPVITDTKKTIEVYSWGLIPRWIKTPVEAVKISNTTINARAETMFEKPAFRGPARSQRCVVLVDGFFEHHHKNGKTFPYHIKLKNDAPMLLAGLWDEWTDTDSGITRRTYTIVTTKGNPTMARIHNNPKASEGPRMPLILPQGLAIDWLKPINDQVDKDLIETLIQPYDENELETFTVKRLRGKEAIGNIPEALQSFRYPELEEIQGSLF